MTVKTRVVKDRLCKIVKEPKIVEPIQNLVKRVNDITSAAYLFAKFILISLDQSEDVNSLICKDFFYEVLLSMTSTKKQNGRNEATVRYRQIINSYIDDFKTLYQIQAIEITYVQQLLLYEATTMLTCYKNNISMRFGQRIRQFVNKMLDVKERKRLILTDSTVDEITRQKALSELRRRSTSIKLMVATGQICETTMATLSNDEQCLVETIISILPKHSYEKESIYYDVKVHPELYLSAYIQLNLLFESHGFKSFNALPLRRSFVPSYITIDTKILVLNVLEHKNLNVIKESSKYDVWEKYFRTNKKAFGYRKELTFRGTIMTDGIGVSIVLADKECKFGRKSKRVEPEEKYIEKASKADLHRDVGKCVLIDPNRRDTLFCMHEDSQVEKQLIYRYTSNQRAVQTRSRKYRKIRKEQKTDVKSMEMSLSTVCSKTCLKEEFSQYLKVRSEVREKLLDHYYDDLYRKLRFNTYVNTQRSEATLVNDMKKKLGNVTTIVMGNHSQNHMRYHEPVKGKGFRKLFRKSGLKVYLIDEFRTSSVCPDCDDRVKAFKWVPNPRLWRRKKYPTVLCHGLLRCTNHQEKECGKSVELNGYMKLWNRDVVAVLNMRRVLFRVRQDGTRPPILSRIVNVTIPA